MANSLLQQRGPRTVNKKIHLGRPRLLRLKHGAWAWPA